MIVLPKVSIHIINSWKDLTEEKNNIKAMFDYVVKAREAKCNKFKRNSNTIVKCYKKNSDQVSCKMRKLNLAFILASKCWAGNEDINISLLVLVISKDTLILFW